MASRTPASARQPNPTTSGGRPPEARNTMPKRFAVEIRMAASGMGHPHDMSSASEQQHTTPVLPTPADVHAAYREGLGPRERAVLWSWMGFTATFAGVRAITYTIRRGDGPFRNVTVGGAHLHHYLWGIGLLAGVGAIAVRGTEKARRHPLVALVYGTGMALIVDEFALLLDLKDVYWTREGRISLDLGIGLVAAGGTTFSALPLLRRLHANRRRHR
jgi:hypothetical protein